MLESLSPAEAHRETRRRQDQTGLTQKRSEYARLLPPETLTRSEQKSTETSQCTLPRTVGLRSRKEEDPTQATWHAEGRAQDPSFLLSTLPSVSHSFLFPKAEPQAQHAVAAKDAAGWTELSELPACPPGELLSWGDGQHQSGCT